MPVARANNPLIRRYFADLGKFLRMSFRFFEIPCGWVAGAGAASAMPRMLDRRSNGELFNRTALRGFVLRLGAFELQPRPPTQQLMQAASEMC
jgi:hypothetical protein